MTTERKHDLIEKGQQDYEEWLTSLTDTPEKRARYKQIAAESDLWLQRAETRLAERTTPAGDRSKGAECRRPVGPTGRARASDIGN